GGGVLLALGGEAVGERREGRPGEPERKHRGVARARDERERAERGGEGRRSEREPTSTGTRAGRIGRAQLEHGLAEQDEVARAPRCPRAGQREPESVARPRGGQA